MRPEQITILRTFGGNAFTIIVSDGLKPPKVCTALQFDEMLGMVAALTIPMSSDGEPYTFRMNPLFLEAPKPPHPDGPEADKKEHLTTETF